MSYTEIAQGKLIPYLKIKSGNLLNFAEVNGLDTDDIAEQVGDNRSTILLYEKGNWRTPKYVFYNEQLYEFQGTVKELGGEDIDITTQTEDGSIEVMYTYYNGGTCFSEMLEEGLEKLNNK